MELRVFPTHEAAAAAFHAERGVGHYFTRMEVTKRDGSRVRFLALQSSDPLLQLRGQEFTKITLHADVTLEQAALLRLLLRNPDGRQSKIDPESAR